jgi:hypothetical protein
LLLPDDFAQHGKWGGNPESTVDPGLLKLGKILGLDPGLLGTVKANSEAAGLQTFSTRQETCSSRTAGRRSAPTDHQTVLTQGMRPAVPEPG